MLLDDRNNEILCNFYPDKIKLHQKIDEVDLFTHSQLISEKSKFAIYFFEALQVLFLIQRGFYKFWNPAILNNQPLICR